MIFSPLLVCFVGSLIITQEWRKISSYRLKICSKKGVFLYFTIAYVGSVWKGGKRGEEDLLVNCYVNSLETAYKNNIRKIAFPSVSTGIYGYPIELASETVMKTVKDYIEKYPDRFDLIRFVLFSENDKTVYTEKYNKIFGN